MRRHTKMGTTDSKLSYKQALLELTNQSKPIKSNNEEFWSQFWYENHIESINDVFVLLSAREIRHLREDAPSNLTTFCYKAIEQIVKMTDTLCNTSSQHRIVMTCSSLLIRIIPYLFEDQELRSFFWSSGIDSEILDDSNSSLAHSLILALNDLLFCPDFTVAPLDNRNNRFRAPDTPPEDLQSIDSCEYIWEAGVGCSISPPSTSIYDQNRTQLLRLLLTCFSESMYRSASNVGYEPNRWIEFFSSDRNRHALPLFTSLLNTVFAYNPNSSLPFNHLLFNDSKEPLVEVSLQILIVVLDHEFSAINIESVDSSCFQTKQSSNVFSKRSFQNNNLFINYISRIHREDDFAFLLKGFTRLLNNPLQQSYLPNSIKKIKFHQELLVLFWKICDYNKKFMYYVLKTCDVLKILVPILYHLNDARADRSRVGLIHIGVFIILLLSGERNFGVRLNRPYQASAPMDLPIFSGTHADLLIIIFHKLISTGNQRLQPLFDCLLTILVNVSPYLKTLSMVASAKILHLLESFSTPWFLFSNPTNHHLVFFLLEIFNNIIQYQFDGNSNLIYMIIRKRQMFHALSNLPSDYSSIRKSFNQFKTNPSKISENSAAARYDCYSSSRNKLKRASSMIESHNESIGNQYNNETSLSHSCTAEDLGSNQYQMMNTSQPITDLDPTDFMEKSTSNQNRMNISLAAIPKLEKMVEKTHPNPKSNSAESDPIEEVVETDDRQQFEAKIQSNRSNPKISRQSSTASEDRSSTTSFKTVNGKNWHPTAEWIESWKQKLPLQTIMRMLQVQFLLHLIYVQSFIDKSLLGSCATSGKNVSR